MTRDTDPFALMSQDQRLAYAERMDRMAGRRNGSVADFLRRAAEKARGGDGFYAGSLA